MTTNQILIGVGLILVLAVGAQVLASRLRIPAIIVLLPAGFIAGALTSDVNPERLLGPAFEPLVSLSVAVILYDAGLGLDLRKLRGPRPHGRDPPDHPGRADHLGARRVRGRAAARHVARRGGDARDHPRRLRADGRGPAAAFRPAGGTPAAGPDLGRVTDRPPARCGSAATLVIDPAGRCGPPGPGRADVGGPGSAAGAVRLAGAQLAPRSELLAAATGRGALLGRSRRCCCRGDEDDFAGCDAPGRTPGSSRRFSGTRPRGRGLSTGPRLPHPARVRQHPPLAMHGQVQGCCR